MNAEAQLDEELALRLRVGGALTAIKGYAAPEVEQTYTRAWALCEQLGQSAELFPVLRGLWNCYLLRGGLQQAHDLSERLVILAEEQGAPLRRALARRALGRRCSISAGSLMRRQRWTRASRSTMRSWLWIITVPTSCSTLRAPASRAGCYPAGPFGFSASPTAP